MKYTPPRFIQFLTDLHRIFSKKYLKFFDKLRLSRVYLVLSFKNFCYGRVPFFNYNQQKFLGFSMEFPNYYSFYIQFRESFIEDIYYFNTQKKAPKILDCGSNIGMTILCFKWIYPESEIIGFEPSPITYELLKKNTANIPGVTLVNSALAGQDGELKFYNNTERPGLSTALESGINFLHKDNFEEITVKKARLSPYISENIDMMKMDIEGMEHEVLMEISDKLHHIERVSMEYHKMKGNPMSGVISELEKRFLIRFVQGRFEHSVLYCVIPEHAGYLKRELGISS